MNCARSTVHAGTRILSAIRFRRRLNLIECRTAPANGRRRFAREWKRLQFIPKSAEYNSISNPKDGYPFFSSACLDCNADVVPADLINYLSSPAKAVSNSTRKEKEKERDMNEKWRVICIWMPQNAVNTPGRSHFKWMLRYLPLAGKC